MSILENPGAKEPPGSLICVMSIALSDLQKGEETAHACAIACSQQLQIGVIITDEGQRMTRAQDWPLWLQIVVGIPNAVGLAWAFLWSPKTEKGLICVYAFIAYIFLFQLLFVWQSALGYLVAGAIGRGLAVVVFLRTRNTGFWPNSPNR